MAEVLEAMGFPTEWCERALKSASGLETAVDLLLQWQAHGMPQYTLPSSVRPSSSPPPSPSSSGKGVLQPQQANSRSVATSGGPILRLQPLPSPSASKAAITGDTAQSPSSTPLPSTSSPCRSSLDGPSAINDPCDSESPSASSQRDSGLRNNPSAASRIGPPENNLPGYRMAQTGNSGVQCISRGGTGGRGAGPSTATEFSVDSTDAVVPDAFAELRKARYAAAQRAKQEKEAERAKIRQQMQEDMALRRFRSSYLHPESDKNKPSVPAVADRGGVSSSGAISMDTAVELQIRCPGNQILKASFTAGGSLKEVRTYVERQLQHPLRVLGAQDHYAGSRPGSAPFSGQSARLSSDRQAERELLQAARENFEVQTSRILASAKSLRDVSGMSQNSNGGIMYFLIPFPRQEFFTESAMETTLAEAQLVPRGTLVVQYRQSELELAKSVQARSENNGSKVGEANTPDNNIHQVSRPEAALVASVDDSMRPNWMAVAPDSNQAITARNFDRGNSSIDSARSETMKSRRTLEMEGERVRVRELALQAAAKRMTEAARIFRAGLPLVEGETGEAFHFPVDTENQENQDAVNDGREKTPLAQEAEPPIDFILTQYPIIPSARLVVDNDSVGLKPAGADAELLEASNGPDEHPIRRERPDGRPLDRSHNGLHRQAVAAAEARIRNSKSKTAVLGGGGYQQDPEAEESRIGESEVLHSVGERARIPESSRLLSRPEKLQRTSIGAGLSNSPISANLDWHNVGGSNHPQRQSQLSIGAASRAAPLEAALQRCKATTEGDSKGKAIVEEHVAPQVAVPSGSVQVETERNSSLRVRLEDGNVVLHTFPASTMLQVVRDSVVPEGAVASEYGFVVPFPDPHFVEGDALASTLEEVGLVPRGTIHLTKLATRGMVRQGRRMSRRRRYVEESDDEEDHTDGLRVLRHLAEHMDDRPDLSYEELMQLEESIGRVNVGVPEEVITTLPTRIVRAKSVESTTEDNAGGDLDLCIVCMAEMVDGEEALSLPCFHTFHTLCIRQWLLQSTCCPTCKQALV